MNVIMNVDRYSLQDDPRFIIPYIETVNRNGVLMPQFGLIRKDGSTVSKPIYDTVLGDCFSEVEIMVAGRMGKVLSYNPKDRSSNMKVVCLYDAYNGYGNCIVSSLTKYELSEDRRILTFNRDGDEYRIDSNGVPIYRENIFNKLKVYGKIRDDKPDDPWPPLYPSQSEYRSAFDDDWEASWR